VFSFWILAAAGSPAEAPAGKPRSERLADIRILLVEDEAVNQLVAFALLKRIGYKADLAENGGEAMDAISRKQYDVVLLDRQLPDMDGVDVARWIRTSKTPHPIVIAVSASTHPEEIASFRAAGIDDFVSKPIDLDALSEALLRASRTRGNVAAD
jgi:CheY-like chemotaxis protein